MYYEDNKDKIQEKDKRYYEDNKEYISTRKYLCVCEIPQCSVWERPSVPIQESR